MFTFIKRQTFSPFRRSPDKQLSIISNYVDTVIGNERSTVEGRAVGAFERPPPGHLPATARAPGLILGNTLIIRGPDQRLITICLPLLRVYSPSCNDAGQWVERPFRVAPGEAMPLPPGERLVP